MIEESSQQPETCWLQQIHEDNPTSRVMTFGYESCQLGAAICTMECFKAAALHLLDDLVELRRGPDLVAVCILWSLDLSIE